MRHNSYRRTRRHPRVGVCRVNGREDFAPRCPPHWPGRVLVFIFIFIAIINDVNASAPVDLQKVLFWSEGENEDPNPVTRYSLQLESQNCAIVSPSNTQRMRIDSPPTGLAATAKYCSSPFASSPAYYGDGQKDTRVLRTQIAAEKWGCIGELFDVK